MWFKVLVLPWIGGLKYGDMSTHSRNWVDQEWSVTLTENVGVCWMWYDGQCVGKMVINCCKIEN